MFDFFFCWSGPISQYIRFLYILWYNALFLLAQNIIFAPTEVITQQKPAKIFVVHFRQPKKKHNCRIRKAKWLDARASTHERKHDEREHERQKKRANSTVYVCKMIFIFFFACDSRDTWYVWWDLTLSRESARPHLIHARKYNATRYCLITFAIRRIHILMSYEILFFDEHSTHQ